MSMGNHYGIELFQIDAKLLDVVLEDFCIVTGIEQNSPAAVFHQRRKPPVFLKRRGRAKRVIQDGYSLRFLSASWKRRKMQ
jgi:hypothetical protein